ncbi:cytochrome c-type biogenesis protein [Marinimicrobium sp. ABcell2]|uniref:cytochrome c-type biogenesis protein n=1 Tax=Marinimicrobium sp. ABcell2 TaxID=3069751 RepID=UPI0027B7D3EC|nr:cytochrome c-type biogenesis protein [Marinimicrobium sp. ABcell2]MDQ2077842.1 cytochrome c-type biogenesis protein CcmH [Marinimicrobium sp. ABcell2]
MRIAFYKLCTVFSLLLACSAWAAIDAYEFDNEVDRKRYLSFIEEMRCPKCQNQNLSGSDSPIASDLRRELYLLIQDGRSDMEIVDFMVDRYGEYILYRPRLSSTTILLWFGPVVLLIGGIVSLILIVLKRRSRNVKVQPERADLTPAERARLDALLHSDSPADKKS